MIGLNKIGLNQVQLNRLRLNAPFPTCRKMAGGGGSGDGFPVLPGDVTRWHFGGLTNEMMAAMDDPRIEDADGKGRFLSFKNFAWKGMSGVGGYSDENYQTFYKFTLDDYVFIASLPSVEYMNFTFRVTGLQPGNKLTLAFFGTTNTVYGTWDKDGIYTVNSAVVEVGKPVYFYNEFYLDIIPEYEGYLVTDGVDDKVKSSIFTMNEDWTIVGDWELLSNVNINCGIVKAQNIYLYNTANGLLISINNPRSLQSFGTKSLLAICSDGRLYDRNWVEYEYIVDQNFAIVESSLNIGFNLNNYTQIAFKNLGIYNDQLLSKDDCIKAYNYLQTLKAK